MAKFLEYQGKEYFKKAGIPVPEGEVVDLDIFRTKLYAN